MKARWIRGLAAGLIALAAVGLTACGDDDAGGGGSEVTGEITVFAAASLTESFTRIGADFEAANPGTKVTFNFAGSSALATQIGQGAPADVFASAAPANMATVADAGDVDGEAVTFVKNQLVIAVPKGNPKGITGLSDLVGPDVKVALCAEQVPCGAAAKKALQAASVELTPVTFEQDVKSVLSKVTLGEVDAALVYRTDAIAAASDVDGVEFAESAGAINEYPIAVLRNAPNKATARAFVDHVLSDPAKLVLTTAGFQAA
ncbi:molybdate ABC transporter substrate-binding protein [Phytomonospora endophytica]|uniref:Molybdate transport system substrate-binding protein n=1 Tax=Phytomonospora endophytica TaxID=714109 RepID=A0A841FES0_9ACTN|nr:molybdate ABC transporter substrate-binding protein [Phytomonospora endophytica]MBB6034766.1 molybdate transport system substrate-binding protein [Phytomonospora endophytica]GIG69031.1 molybdate-binding protein [Phytomonospora endophytica]